MLETKPHTNGTESRTRRVGLVTRVSTDLQAANPEGSLTTQLQRLRQHIDYKRSVAGEDWIEAAVYELRGISGKDSARSSQFEAIYSDVRSGSVNTILCTSLERVCRSVKDFLAFFEFLNDHGAEFVCLKQNYDTTSPQGKLFVTIMMALAEFEREQTSERTRDATLARAERGLWNGGRLLGYDLDQDRKGYLIPNEAEAALVNFAFDTYLRTGSFAMTRETLNERGYRTKSYTSRRQKHHPGKPFCISSVQYMLKNSAYVGKKEINKKDNDSDGRLVAAVWPAIVDASKFQSVERLIVVNSRTNHNNSRRIRHVYVLSRGLMHCGRCRSAMEGRSGTGRLGVRYYYYVCKGPECGLRVIADEVEGAVIERIGELASAPDVLSRLVDETNRRMTRQKPALVKQRRSHEKSLEEVKDQADALLTQWSAKGLDSGRDFVMDKLAELGRRRGELEHALRETDSALERLDSESVSADTIRATMTRFSEVYDALTPFERKELVRLVLDRVEVGDRQITLDIYPLAAPALAAANGHSRSEEPNWLPGQDSNL